MKNFRIFLLVVFGIGLIFTAKPFLLNTANAQSANLEATDAIAVRVMPNPNHYSIARWYESQGFSGAPQALVVDGYEAVRDGRTVYINATNVDGKNIYTNVYLISYNQSSAAKTVDILGQIVNHWKFNSNLGILESTNPAPSCAISNKNCLMSSDCGADQICASSGSASSTCILKKTINCLIDSECPTNFFCNSLKSKIIRDVKRIGQIEELKEALFKYKSKVVNNHFPILASGTYIANHSISVWPSWSQNLLANLGVSGNFVDPINRLGSCPGYDIKTCWNNTLNKFITSPSQTSLTLPSGSYAFVYKTDAKGSAYNLCTAFETRDALLGYKFSPNDPISNVCLVDTGTVPVNPTVNSAPILVSTFLSGETGQEFNGYFEVVDKENDPLTWSLYTNGIPWNNWVNGGTVNSAPILVNSNILNQKKVFANLAGDPGDYTVGLRVDDGKGGVLSTSSVIKILNSAPLIEADNLIYVLSSYTPFSYSFIFSDNNLVNPNVSFSVTKLSGPFDIWDESKTITFTQSDSHTYKVTHSGLVSTTHKILKDTDFTYRLKVTDKYGLATSKDVTIKVVVEKPVLDFNCSSKTRLGKSYNCVLGSAISNSRKDIIYSSENSIYNTYITKSSSSIFSIGAPVWTTANLQTSIIATDEYGATSSRAFSLIANNYCGDGKAQFPNTEGQGGPYNNGYESCDGLEGTTNIVASSSPTMQYSCSTKVNEITPDIITTQNYCRFPSPANGGGYCGDTVCSSVDAGGPETTCNCPKDCGTAIDCGGVKNPCVYEYSWAECQSNNTQIATVISALPSGCVGTPLTSRTCVYQEPIKTCHTQADCAAGYTCKSNISYADPSVYYCTGWEGTHGCMNSGLDINKTNCTNIPETAHDFSKCQNYCNKLKAVTINNVANAGLCTWSVQNGICYKNNSLFCGDGLCNNNETTSSCPGDCRKDCDSNPSNIYSGAIYSADTNCGHTPPCVLSYTTYPATVSPPSFNSISNNKEGGACGILEKQRSIQCASLLKPKLICQGDPCFNGIDNAIYEQPQFCTGFYDFLLKTCIYRQKQLYTLPAGWGSTLWTATSTHEIITPFINNGTVASWGSCATKVICGDKICSLEYGENCDSCTKDCGSCPVDCNIYTEQKMCKNNAQCIWDSFNHECLSNL